MQTIHKRIIIITLSISLGLILINALSTVFNLWGISVFLFNLIDALGFHPSTMGLQHYPWGIFTYPWVHYDVISLLLNMLLLWTIGGIFLSYHRGTTLLSIYLMGAFSGAVLYSGVGFIVNLMGIEPSMLTLFGSSASICALSFALAVSQPSMRVQIPLVGSANFLTLIIVLYALSAILSASYNWGGMMAHLGGAIYGTIWGLCTLRGRKDYPTMYLDRLAAYIEQKRQKSKEHQPFKNKPTAEQIAAFRQGYKKDEKLERILNKIRLSGYSSLSEDEQTYLRQTKD